MDNTIYQYKYPHPAVTVDCVVFGLDKHDLKILLIRRAEEPFKGKWALPGGFVHIDEELEAAAKRELREETGVIPPYLEQFHTFGKVDRDPRERVLSVGYYALVNLSDHRVKASTDASDAGWFSANDLPSLAFDHEKIYEMALSRLRHTIRFKPVGFELLPKHFTLSALQHLYEKTMDQVLDKRNFRKKILSSKLLIETDEVETDVAHRAARLYRFDKSNYQKLVKSGFNFQL